MITTDELARAFAPRLLRSLCCPVCLRDLRLAPARGDQLVCVGCAAVYGSVDGLPILLIEDENWRRKEDEISGEVAFNTDTVPTSVHLERNAFVDGNTAELLQDADFDLSSADVLVVGCSMSELEFFVARSRSVCCLDIVPSLSLQALRETRRRNLDASWVCGDGEALPCGDETFDVVVVRQALHHMLNYGAAVREFFRVCRTGGTVLLVDEPFGAADGEAPPLSTHADHRRVLGDVQLAHVRTALGLALRAEDATGISGSGSGSRPAPATSMRCPGTTSRCSRTSTRPCRSSACSTRSTSWVPRSGCSLPGGSAGSRAAVRRSSSSTARTPRATGPAREDRRRRQRVRGRAQARSAPDAARSGQPPPASLEKCLVLAHG